MLYFSCTSISNLAKTSLCPRKSETIKNAGADRYLPASLRRLYFKWPVLFGIGLHVVLCEGMKYSSREACHVSSTFMVSDRCTDCNLYLLNFFLCYSGKAGDLYILIFIMRHVAAYLLAAMGTGQPNAASIKAILGSVGVEADEKQLTVLLDKLSGKNLAQLIQDGSALISSMPACGGGGGGAAAPAAGTAAAPAAEEKKEEKKEEPEEESDDDMGFGLFD
ncbi:large ribosomal subunit protein P2-like [Scylla paramamosain]